MAALKSTASSVPSKSKARKTSLAEIIAAETVSRRPDELEIGAHIRTTLRKAYGVLVCGRLVFQSMKCEEAVAYRDGRGLGTVIELDTVYGEAASTKALFGTSEGERDKFKGVSVDERTNPLAKIVEEQFGECLASIDEALDSEFYCNAPTGRPHWSMRPNDDYGYKAATDEECYFAELDPVNGGQFLIDLRKPIPRQVARGLRKLGRHYLELADQFMARVRRGEVELRQVTGYVVMQDGKPICESTGERAAGMLATWTDGAETEVVPVFAPAGKAVK